MTEVQQEVGWHGRGARWPALLLSSGPRQGPFQGAPGTSPQCSEPSLAGPSCQKSAQQAPRAGHLQIGGIGAHASGRYRPRVLVVACLGAPSRARKLQLWQGASWFRAVAVILRRWQRVTKEQQIGDM